MARMAQDAGFTGDLPLRRHARLGQVRDRGEPDAPGDGPRSRSTSAPTCRLPLVLDAGGGWGESGGTSTHPSRLRRSRGLRGDRDRGSAACHGRFEHHVGIDHLVPTEFFHQEAQGGTRRPHRSESRDHRAHQCHAARPAASRRRSAAARPSPRPAPDMVFCFTPQPRGGAHGRRAGAAALMTFAPVDGF